MNITTIGLDIAKHVFPVHGVDAHEKVVVRKAFRRGQMIAFFSALPRGIMGTKMTHSCYNRSNPVRYPSEVRFVGFRDIRILIVVIFVRIFGTDPFRYVVGPRHIS
jgi:transposase